MMKVLSIVMLFLIFSFTNVFAQNLGGTMSDEGNGTYTLSVRGPNGMTYYGEAEDYGDGKLHVVLEDQDDETYQGTVHAIGDNQYSLHVENDITDVQSFGIVTMVNKNHWFLEP
jgi:hypothetical protein